MKKFAVLAILLSLFCFDACAVSAQSWPTVDTNFRDNVRLPGVGGGFVIPLPPGDWITVGVEKVAQKDDTGKPVSGEDRYQIYLIQLQGKSVKGVVYMSTPTEPHMSGYLPSQNCKRNDALYRQTVSATTGREIDCRIVVHRWLARSASTSSAYGQMFQYILDHKLLMPPRIMIDAQYERASGMKQMNLSYWFNPIADGLVGENPPNWATSQWHKDRVAQDPIKQSYADKIIQWSKEWAPNVEQGFKGRERTVD